MFPNILRNYAQPPQRGDVITDNVSRTKVNTPPSTTAPQASDAELRLLRSPTRAPIIDSSEKRCIYTVLMGIDTYEPSLNIPSLLLSTRSLNAFDAMLGKIPTYGAEVHRLLTLTNHEVTLNQFHEAMDQLHRAPRRRMPTDIVIFYIACHGRVRINAHTGLSEPTLVLYDGTDVPLVDIVNYFNSDYYAAYVVVDAGFGGNESRSSSFRTSGLPPRVMTTPDPEVIPSRNTLPEDKNGGEYQNVFGNNIALWCATPPPALGRATGPWAVDGLFTHVMTHYLTTLSALLTAPLGTIHALMSHRMKVIGQEFFLDGYLGFFESFGLLLGTPRADREPKYVGALLPGSGHLRTMSAPPDVNTASVEVELQLAEIRHLYNNAGDVFEHGRICCVHRGSIATEHPRYSVIPLGAPEESITQVRLDELCRGELESRTVKKLLGYRGRPERIFQSFMTYSVPDLQAYATGERYSLFQIESIFNETCWISRMWLWRHLHARAFHTRKLCVMFFPNSKLSAGEPDILVPSYKKRDMDIITLKESQCTSGGVVWVLSAIQSGLRMVSDLRTLVVHISCESAVIQQEHVLYMADTTQSIGSGDELRSLSSGLKYRSVIDNFLSGLPPNVTTFIMLDTSKRRVTLPLVSSPACDDKYVEPPKSDPHPQGRSPSVHIHAAHDGFHSLGVIGCSNFARALVDVLEDTSTVYSTQNVVDGLGEKLRRFALLGGQVQYLTCSGVVDGNFLEPITAVGHATTRAYPIARTDSDSYVISCGTVHGVSVGGVFRDVHDATSEYVITEIRGDYESTAVVKSKKSSSSVVRPPTNFRLVVPVPTSTPKSWYVGPRAYDGDVAFGPFVGHFQFSSDLKREVVDEALHAFVDYIQQKPPQRSLYHNDAEFRISLVDTTTPQQPPTPSSSSALIPPGTHHITLQNPLQCSLAYAWITFEVTLPSYIPLEEDGISTSYLTIVAMSPSFGIHLVYQSALNGTSSFTSLHTLTLESIFHPDELATDVSHAFRDQSTGYPIAILRVYVSSEPLQCLPLQRGLHPNILHNNNSVPDSKRKSQEDDHHHHHKASSPHSSLATNHIQQAMSPYLSDSVSACTFVDFVANVRLR
eukprot:PhF_6_TR29355/c0_g1_i1/m.43176